jgi:flavorubredoxin
MGITNSETGTRVDEVADGIYRISTPIPPGALIPGGFSFNQYLVVDDEPLLMHTGMKKLFPVVQQAIESVLPVSKLRWITFGHMEADECGSLPELLAAAPNARPLCGQLQAMLVIGDLTDREPHVLANGAERSIGRKRVTWFDAPHVPHGWDNGFLFEGETRTLFCGDLFTQAGHDNPPLHEGDLLGPAEAMRKGMDYYAHTPGTRAVLERLAETKPRTLACMHGSAWRGDGAPLLTALADALERP